MNTADLTHLIDVSLRQWQIEARFEEVGALIDPEQIAVAVTLSTSEKVVIQRVHDEGARLPVWRFAIGARRPVEAVSLRQILKALRMELDSRFVPGRTIIGPRPSADTSSREAASQETSSQESGQP